MEREEHPSSLLPFGFDADNTVHRTDRDDGRHRSREARRGVKFHGVGDGRRDVELHGGVTSDSVAAPGQTTSLANRGWQGGWRGAASGHDVGTTRTKSMAASTALW
ncbi:hypothetical protein EJB05_36072 [Eragrostis curvula]|uniref:Uncharacterized protein n=1 Tax=Eragrostis curvula TaxID=38414 RepID=A0A5J9U863_9POAL|nr:hypothetical protein EJB05_36072 [Eragrostis curvula]